MQDAGPEHSLKRYCTNARELKIEAVDPATLLKRLYDSTDSALPVGARLGNSHFGSAPKPVYPFILQWNAFSCAMNSRVSAIIS